jgi:hypothetical protein
MNDQVVKIAWRARSGGTPRFKMSFGSGVEERKLKKTRGGQA